MRKYLYLWSAILAVILIFGFFGWILPMHGTTGLLRLNSSVRLLFIVLALFGVVLLGFTILEWFLRRKGQVRGIHFLSPIVRVMTVIGIIIPLLGFIYIADIPSSVAADKSPQLLLMDGTGTNGVPNMAVTFHTAKKTQDTLKWGSGESNETLTEEAPSREHVFILSDLQPDTIYWYQVNNGQLNHFKTPPVDGQPLHFAVFSDAHFGVSSSRNDLSVKMLQYIADPTNNFNLLFSCGDLVEYGFRDSCWQKAFQAMSSISPVIPTKYTAGNHDTMMGGLGSYEAYCYPEGMELQTGTRLWNRIDVGQVHFLVIDLEWSAESYTDAQNKWLETQLTSIPQDDWTIVIGHGFYYASGSRTEGWNWYDNPETINKLTPLFEKYHVDMVFSGHAHQLELLQKSGVTYVVCGTFGGALESEREYTSPASVWYSVKNYAFVDVTIDGTEANLIFRDSSYAVLNSFTVNNR